MLSSGVLIDAGKVGIAGHGPAVGSHRSQRPGSAMSQIVIHNQIARRKSFRHVIFICKIHMQVHRWRLVHTVGPELGKPFLQARALGTKKVRNFRPDLRRYRR